jgi:triphosphatase
MASDREFELKFLSRPDVLERWQKEPLLSAVSPRTREKLCTAYFDTPDHSLKDRGVFLRIRRSPSGFIQSVKQADGLSRGEWEHAVSEPLPDSEFSGDCTLQDFLQEKKNAGGLSAIFETDVDRTSFLLREQGSEIEVSFDRGAIKAGNKHLPISEVELELKSGDPAALFALAQHFVASERMLLSFVSKGERGFLLAEGTWGQPRKVSLPKLQPGIAAGDAFKRLCNACLHAFMLNIFQFDQATKDIEFVHQARVAIRKLRAALSFFQPLVEDSDFLRLRGELKWISDLLGQARDLDVWQTHVFVPKARERESNPGFALLAQHMEERRRQAYSRLAEAIDSDRLRKLLLDFTIWLETSAWKSPTIESFVDDYLTQRLDRLVKSGRDLKKMDETSQHRLRIRAKKLRYMAEFFENLSQSHKRHEAFEQIAKALAEMQSALGDIHDNVALKAYLATEFGCINAKSVLPQDVPAAFAAGVLVRAAPPRRKLLRQAEKAYGELTRWKKFWS